MIKLSAFVLALAVSVDSLGVGLSYGMKGMHVPPASLFLLSGLSTLAMLSSMLAGRAMGSLLPVHLCRWLGGSMLAGMGLASFFTAWRSQRTGSSPQAVEQRLLFIRIKPLGLIIQVIKEPAQADLDLSGEISSSEAVLLGTALGLDALGAGLGAALTAFPPVLTAALVGLTTFFTLKLGLHLGQRMPLRDGYWPNLVHGGLLVIIGLYRLL